MKITAEQIKKVREATGAPIARAKEVLLEVEGDEKKAMDILKKEGHAKMEKRTDRATSAGKVVTYEHHTGKVAAVFELLCETDFVAKNELFVELANDIAMQIASMNPKDENELLGQPFIKNPKSTIEDLIKDVRTKTGENVQIGRFSRIEIGE